MIKNKAFIISLCSACELKADIYCQLSSEEFKLNYFSPDLKL